MRAVDLDDLEARLERQLRRGGELGDDVAQLLAAQLVRHGVALVEGDRAGPQRRPAALLGRQRPFAAPRRVGAALAARVGELEARDGAVGADLLDDAGEGLGLRLVPQPQVVRADAAFGGDAGGLEQDQARSADGAGDVVLEVPVVRGADGEAVGVGAVLAHRRHPHPVGDVEVAQADGVEERGGQGGVPNR